MRYARPFAAFAANAIRLTLLACLSLALSLCAAAPGRAQDLQIYTDSLQNGFANWSWATTNLSNTSPVQSGSDSVAVTYAGGYQGFYLHSGNNINTVSYSALSFWVNGGATGGQQFVIHCQNAAGATLPSVPVTNYVSGGSIPANAWVHVVIPFADLGIVGLTDFNAFWFQESKGTAQPVYYVDTMSLLAAAAPSVVHVSVTATQPLQTVDSRDFGVNTAIWDSNLGTATTDSLMNASGAGVFRYPGGSASDGYDWTVLQYNGQSTTPTFGTLTDATGAQAIVTANYGSGSPQMAAAWVAYCNAMPSSTVTIGLDSAGRDWKTASYWASLRGATPLGTDDGLNFLRVNHPAPYGFKNWEIGNECYGSWENDTHASKQDPVTYANVALAMTTLMKQVDPTIQTGVVVTSTEDDSGNQTETVTNPVTGVQHKGWTAVLCSTLNGINYVPDYVIYHNYAQAPGGESDSILLQYAPSWLGDASSIRTILTDYFGAAKAAPCQLVCTENNSVYTNPGKQSTSLVNGLYYVDSLGYLMQTEFKGMVWWDLRNGQDASQNNSSSLYGWRLYGDYGMLGAPGAQPGGNQDTPYPTYFGLKLASKFARGGDTIVTAATDYAKMDAFAAKRAGGGLSVMVVNKDPSNTLTTQFALSGYTPTGTATTYQYGETQDNLQSTGATVDLAQSTLTGVGSTFSTSLPPYSMTVITMAPVLPVTTASLAGTSGTNGWYKSPVTVTLSATAGAAWTVASTYYTVDGGARQTYSAPFSVSADGTHTVTYWSVDSAGNTEATNTLTFKTDATAPVTTGSASGTTVTLTATDNLSGIAATYYTIDGGAQTTYAGAFTVTANAPHTIQYWSVDAAGNIETAHTLTISNDTIPPVTTASLAGTLGSNGWYKSAVTVTLTATDNLSGVASTSYTVDGGTAQTYSAPFTVLGDGTHTVTYWSVDKAGNTEATNTLTIKIDATAPTLAFGAASPAANASGWNNSTVSIPYMAGDATSGVATATPGSPLTFASQGAGQTQTVTVTDNAGNTAAFTSPAVSIDLTAPVTTGSASGTTVTLTATDNLSGVAATYYTIDGGAQTTYTKAFTVTGVATHTVAYWSVDKAGNTETAHTLTVTITPVPVLTAIAPSFVTAGTGAFTLTLTGSGFGPSSTVFWAGTALTLTSVSGTQLTATIPASYVATAGTAVIYVQNPMPGGGKSTTKTFTIRGVILAGLKLSPTSVVYGNPVTATLTLTGPAPAGGLSITMSSNNTAASVPASVTVPAGSTTYNVAVTTSKVTKNTTVTISASSGRGSKSATVIVKP